jgi:uncharacterized protein (DUF362 family)
MKTSDKINPVDRRKFISSSILSGLGYIFPQKAFALMSKYKTSTVVVIEDSYATNGIDIIKTKVQNMVDNGIMSLTGSNNVGEAWKSLMPGINSSSIIAIKVNCSTEILPTHPEVTYAVTNGLVKMLIDGKNFSENNIHIYDNDKAYLELSGYTINKSPVGIQCYMETSFSTPAYSVNGKLQHICSLVHDKADYIINIGVLKNDNFTAGVSLCMKNHFGSIDKPGSLKVNAGNPYIGALNAIKPIKSKQVINILDCLLGAAEGGTWGAPTFVANKIIMSSDPVAVDYLGRELLIKENSSTASKATYIDSAANYGIGTNNPNLMDIIYVDNTVDATDDNNCANHEINVASLCNYPNPFSNQTTFEFELKTASEVSLEINSSVGFKVATLIQGYFHAGNHSVIWNGENNSGKKVQNGLYVGKFQAGDFRKALVLNLKS